MKPTLKPLSFAALALAGFLATTLQLSAQGTAFTYQGRLTNGSTPVTGTNDFEFRLFGVAAGGMPVAPAVARDDVPIVDGFFTVNLDFGTTFSGGERFLEIGVREGTNSGAYATLLPRQVITSAPYAVRALEAATLPAGAITSAMLAPGAVTQLGAPDGSPVSALQVSTNGFVGLGTSTPQAGLHLNAGELIYTPTVRFAQADENDPFGADALGGASAVASTAAGDLFAVAAATDAAVSPVVPNLPFVLPQPELRAANGYTNLAGATAVVFSGRLLITAASTADAVTLTDLTAPASPVKRAELRNGFGGFNELDSPVGVAVSGSLLAIASANSDAVTLADLTNPANPLLRSTIKDGQFGFDFLNGASEVAFNGNLLAIGASVDNAVTLVDVSTPTTPVLRAVLRDSLGGFNQLAGISALAWSGNMLIVAASTDDSLTLIDCTVPTNPVLLATLTNGVGGVDGLDAPTALAVRNDLLAVTAGVQPYGVLSLINIANPAQPAIRAVWRDNQSDLHYLSGASGVAWLGPNLVVSSRADNAYTILTPDSRFVALASDGLVGVGTTRPAAPLHVVGNVIVQNAGLVQVETDSFAAGRNASAPGLTATAFGSSTVASGDYSLAGGLNTKALGQYSVALGYESEAHNYLACAIGFDCVASNYAAFALGVRARALHNDSFVWSDGSWNGTPADFYFDSERQGQFRLRAAGGVDIRGSSNAPAFSYSAGRKGGFDLPVGYGENTNTSGFSSPALRLVTWGGDSAEGVLSVSTMGNGNLARFGNISAFVSTLTANGTWSALAFNPTSDRAAKENFSPVDPQDVLDKVAALPLQRWNYKAAPGLEHIGPVAQDFHAAFGLNGADDKHISTVDADGVALAAIQGLNEKVEVRSEKLEIRSQKSERRIQKLEAENAQLKLELENLRRLVDNLTDANP